MGALWKRGGGTLVVFIQIPSYRIFLPKLNFVFVFVLFFQDTTLHLRKKNCQEKSKFPQEAQHLMVNYVTNVVMDRRLPRTTSHRSLAPVYVYHHHNTTPHTQRLSLATKISRYSGACRSLSLSLHRAAATILLQRRYGASAVHQFFS